MEIKKQEKIKLTLTLNENEIEKLMQVVWFALDYQSEQKKKGITEMNKDEEKFANYLYELTSEITFRDKTKNIKHKGLSYVKWNGMEQIID